MSYSVGRLALYVDTETAKADYTNEVFDSMTDPLVTQLCNLFGMVVFDDLTEETTRGNRYFIGFDGAEYPSFAIGWAVGNTYASAYFLMMVGMFQGSYLSNLLDASGTSYISPAQYGIPLINRYFGNASYNYNYINYLKTPNFVGISYGFAGNSATVTQTGLHLVFCMFKSGTDKLIVFKNYTNNSSQYDTYDFENNGIITGIIPNVGFVNTKNVIGNSDFNYIVLARIKHYKPITDIYIYSASLTENSIYYINGEYYYCLTTNNSNDSYLVKIEDYVP